MHRCHNWRSLHSPLLGEHSAGDINTTVSTHPSPSPAPGARMGILGTSEHAAQGNMGHISRQFYTIITLYSCNWTGMKYGGRQKNICGLIFRIVWEVTSHCADILSVSSLPQTMDIQKEVDNLGRWLVQQLPGCCVLMRHRPLRPACTNYGRLMLRLVLHINCCVLTRVTRGTPHITLYPH